MGGNNMKMMWRHEQIDFAVKAIVLVDKLILSASTLFLVWSHFTLKESVVDLMNHEISDLIKCARVHNAPYTAQPIALMNKR